MDNSDIYVSYNVRKVVKGESQMCQEKSFLFEHNREVYEQLENHLSVDNKAIVVLGTGIGKTTTALEYLNNHQVRGLVICPQNAIRADWDKADEYVDTITYSKFAKVYQDIDYSNYGAVICDEVHHVGADKWGAGIKYIIDNDLCKVIGLTATPDRTDKIDIVNNIFSGNICQGLDMLAGIKEGIVHPFTYAGAYYDTDGLKEENENEERRKEDKEYDLLCGKLDLAINNTPSLNEIITSNMPEGDRKIIVFVSDIDSITEAKQILKPIFPNLEHRSLHSGLSKEEIKENREWFKNANEGLLYTINMASERIHYIGVNTLIMFRRTCSDIVFTQQMGRISTLTKYENPNAIVFDLVNNAKTVGNFKMAIKELSKEYSPREIRDILREHSTNEKSNQIIVRDYTGDIVDVLEEMKRYDDDSWTEEEDNILREFYPTEGPSGCAKRLENRTPSAIQSHARRYLGLHYLFSTVIRIDPKTKEYKQYNKISEVEQDGFSRGGVIQCCQRKMQKSGGYYWAYIEDFDEEWEPTEVSFEKGKSMNREVFCFETNEIYSSAREASAMTGCNLHKILRCCDKKEKGTGGKHFCWGEDRLSYELKDIQKRGETFSKEELENLKLYSTMGMSKEFLALFPNRTKGSLTQKLSRLGYKTDIIQKPFKKVRCIELDKIFDSIGEANNFVNASISHCLSGKNKTAGGYHWEYVEEENEETEERKDE